METEVTVTVRRSTWLRGEGSFRSFLLRPSDGKMCCLGFCLVELGRSKEEITDKKAPNSFLGKHRLAPNGATLNDPDEPRLGDGTVLDGKTSVVKDIIGNAMALNDTFLGHEVSTWDGTLGRNLLVETEEVRESLIGAELAKIGINIQFVD